MEYYNSKYNDALNYRNREFYSTPVNYQERSYSIYKLLENEEVIMPISKPNWTKIEEIEKSFSEKDFAIIEEIARSKYISSKQIYEFLNLREIHETVEGLRRRLNKMLRLRVIREYLMVEHGNTQGARAYDLDFKGYEIAKWRGVFFHGGNYYRSYSSKVEMDLLETAEDLKRVLMGNMIVLGLLKNGANIRRFGIMEILMLKDKEMQTGDNIMRTACNVLVDDDTFLLYEVVRSTEGSLDRLKGKIQRYYGIVNSPDYSELNNYGYNVLPQLVICGENYEHNLEINNFLREEGMYREEDELLYTEDLFYVQPTLKNLYTLDERGNQSWYAIERRK